MTILWNNWEVDKIQDMLKFFLKNHTWGNKKIKTFCYLSPITFSSNKLQSIQKTHAF